MLHLVLLVVFLALLPAALYTGTAIVGAIGVLIFRFCSGLIVGLVHLLGLLVAAAAAPILLPVALVTAVIKEGGGKDLLWGVAICALVTLLMMPVFIIGR